jgi:hypothetical protein
MIKLTGFATRRCAVLVHVIFIVYVLCVLQAFFEYFQALPGQQRLIGYSVYGDTYYAAPGGDTLELTASFASVVMLCLPW